MKTKLLMLLSLVVILGVSSCSSDEEEFTLPGSVWMIDPTNDQSMSGEIVFSDSTYTLTFDPGITSIDLPTEAEGEYEWDLVVVYFDVDGDRISAVMMDDGLVFGGYQGVTFWYTGN